MVEVGDVRDDGGELFVLTVELVEGLSAPRLSVRDCIKALKTHGLGGKRRAPESPKDAELRLTYVERVDLGALAEKMDEFSEANESLV